MSRRVNPEIRAAEIVAAIKTTYRRGGWFACMTPGEQAGWDMHEREWYYGDDSAAPRNAREWAGWLARETVYPFNVATEGES